MSKCFHSELRRERHELTDGYIDVWYCPEPGCDFEIEPWAGLVQLKGYGELVMAVERKFPDETRHQTALRYIREAESRANEPGVAASQLNPNRDATRR